MLMVSNFALLLPIWRALQIRQYMRAFVFAGSMVSSFFYHLCKPANGFCVIPYYALGNFDFLFAILQLVVTGLYLIPFDEVYVDPSGEFTSKGAAGAILKRHSLRHIEDLIILSYGFFIAIRLSLGHNGYLTFSLVGGSVMAIVFIALIYNYVAYGIRPHFDWLDLVIAFALLTVGATLFIVQEFMSHHVYWIVHSIWHTCAAIGQFYLLDSRNWQYRGVISLKQSETHFPAPVPVVDPVYSQPSYAVHLILARLGYPHVWRHGYWER